LKLPSSDVAGSSPAEVKCREGAETHNKSLRLPCPTLAKLVCHTFVAKESHAWGGAGRCSCIGKNTLKDFTMFASTNRVEDKVLVLEDIFRIGKELSGWIQLANARWVLETGIVRGLGIGHNGFAHLFIGFDHCLQIVLELMEGVGDHEPIGWCCGVEQISWWSGLDFLQMNRIGVDAVQWIGKGVLLGGTMTTLAKGWWEWLSMHHAVLRSICMQRRERPLF
jgi:hypothetical protein